MRKKYEESSTISYFMIKKGVLSFKAFFKFKFGQMNDNLFFTPAISNANYSIVSFTYC